jgi:hypothetical protein
MEDLQVTGMPSCLPRWPPRRRSAAAGPRASPRRERILPEPWFKRKFDGWTTNSAVYMCKFYMHILLAKQRGKTAQKNVFSVPKNGRFSGFHMKQGEKTLCTDQYVGFANSRSVIY